MMEFTVEEFTVYRVATFLNEALRQIYGQIWTAKCDINNRSFDDSKIAVVRSVRKKPKINLRFASLILQFTASMLGSKVQLASPTVNICGKA